MTANEMPAAMNDGHSQGFSTSSIADHETQVLGAMLSTPKCIPFVRAIINGEDFHDWRHRDVFNAILRTTDAGVTPDPVTVADHIPAKDLARAGGQAYLHQLYGDVLTASNADWHAEKLAEAAKVRRERAIVNEMNRSGDVTGLLPHLVESVAGDSTHKVASMGEQHSGQVRMAYKLAAAYADRLLYVHGIGWHYYDGQRWAEDVGDVRARRAVMDVLKRALTASLGDKQLRADVAKCESAAGVKGVLSIAEALEFAATVNDIDADPWMLNCANGTLDLRTRELLPHNPRDRITKAARGAYDPGADKAEWIKFLTSALPDDDVRAYLQRVFGQATYGSVREHMFPILTGTGGNGKGTCYEAVLHAFGDYATPINPDMLMQRERGGVGGPELMTLLGVRLAIGSETNEGRQLDEATMKWLTGGDSLTARNLYESPVSWNPTHQLVYVTNHLPKVKGNSPAVWRRMRVVPFNITFADDTKDGDVDLPARLELQADGILTWAVEGYFDYVDNGGMREPASVKAATHDYQAESDDVGRFVAEACVTGSVYSAKTRTLFGAWQKWAQVAGDAKAIAERAFGKELDRLGYESGPNYGPRLGIAPKPEDTTDSSGSGRW
ncbi:hypothetical protein GCM10011492_06630 [Flexivirga endophytica]|uniref:SF3 helicase domain-containing protein n=1 Tax=Flexivirga endophytica TaxID=1849103 RepID=A0A916SYP6_9MICO|nr:phage/plasmid primase, P4 family [Flexivirga endophytica]GGB19472.1 hypothetical protein GCM10011492_06630 [Flexivirga endophytica]GHB36237.1 hypothetical protein GCM10008112_00980 [Flexivirga endophytica]